MKFFFRKRDQQSANSIEDDRDHIEGERAVPSVNKGLGMQTKITNFLIFASIIVIAGFLLFKYYANMLEHRREQQQATERDTKQTAGARLPPLVPPAFGNAAAPASTSTAPPLGNAGNAQQQKLDANGQPILSPAEQLLQHRLNSPVLFSLDAAKNNRTGSGSGSSDAGDEAAGPARLSALGAADDRSDSLANSLKATKLDAATASLLPDRNFLITQGSSIRCTVDPALDSTLPGIETCTGSDDVYSANHQVLLLERGTKYVGQSKQALVQGQKRLGVVWTRAETPNGVIVPLDTGSADELGRPGIEGEVDNHFWARFGAAFVYSFFDDVAAYEIAKQQSSGSGGGNTTIAFPNTISGSNNVASEILKQTANIPPTLRKVQGGNISLIVGRDLDFSHVYTLKVKQ